LACGRKDVPKPYLLELKQNMSMDKFLLLIFLAALLLAWNPHHVLAQALEYDLNFSMYIGGNAYEHARDVFADSYDNVYVVGGTNSDNFPTTPGAFKRTHNRSGTQIGSAGYMDAFVMKFDPNGNIIWSTLIGGPNYDRAYNVEVDSQGYVYVAGRGGPGLPTTAGAFQPTFYGCQINGPGAYGYQNGFIAKIKPDGSGVVWLSYFGVGQLIRDMDIDENGDIYVTSGYYPAWSAARPDLQWPSWFSNAYRKIPYGGDDIYVAKVKSDGTQVYWATYIGGSGDESDVSGVRVYKNPSSPMYHHVYVLSVTTSTDCPWTSGAYQQVNRGQHDYFLARFNSDGTSLMAGTYIGSSGDDWDNTHNLVIDTQGNFVVTVSTPSSTTSWPTTAGAFQTTHGGVTDTAVSKISSDGTQLLASTFIGGNANDNPDGVSVDAQGDIYVTGNTGSTNFPVTSSAYQPSNAGSGDAFLVGLSSDFSHLLYSTYMGGPSDDGGRNSFLGQDGSLYMAGQTNGTGWPTKNAYQSTYQGGALDIVLAKFSPPKVIFNLNFSTYIGGTLWENIRGITTDPQGYIYITGGTNSPTFPTTFGPSHQSPPGNCINPGGQCSDIFVTKLTPNGQQIVWSRLLGTNGHDRAYGIKYDTTGYLLLHGRMSNGYTMTSGVVQTAFGGWGIAGVDGYGPQNGFIGKLDPNNGNIVWISYIGSASLVRDATIDELGNVYVVTGYEPSLGSPWRPDQQYPAAFANAYRKTPYSGNVSDSVVFKISANGIQILWGTYFGGSNWDESAQSIGVHRTSKNIYICGQTQSTDLPGTANVFSQGRNYHGGRDYFVAKFSSDGSSLLWSAYLGGSGDEFHNSQNLVVEQSTGNVYVSPFTTSANYPTTSGAFQTTIGGGYGDVAISKISSDGTTLMASTFVGGNSNDNSDGLVLDSVNHRIYFTGNTGSTNFPVTSNAYQSTNTGGSNEGDGFLGILSDDLTQLLYSTYLGGSGDDGFRAAFVNTNGDFLCGGMSNSDNWPVLNAIQSSRAGDVDNILVKFSPAITDIIPPYRSNGQPTGTLLAGTTNTALSLTTDDNANCKYSTSAGVAYSSMPNSFATTGGTSHTTTVSGLQDGQSYTYYVRCQDAAGNNNTNDFPISFSVASPTPTCQNQGYQCCSSCQSGPHTQYDYTCTGQVCCDTCVHPQTNLCTNLILHHHYDNNPAYGESSTHVYDFSGTGNNGTAQYNAFISQSRGRFSGTSQFDGDGDYILVPNNPTLNFGSNIEFAISAWVKTSGTDTQQILLSKRAGAGWMIWLDSNPRFRIDEGANIVDTPFTFPFGSSWHNIIAMRNATHHSVWVDGIIRGITADSTLADLTDLINLTIGNEIGYAPSAITGSIDELAIWNRSLSSQEIQQLYASASPISCFHRADSNKNGCVEDLELTAFIDKWKVNSSDVTLRELIEAIGLWKKGC